jgi:hypothetical protein
MKKMFDVMTMSCWFVDLEMVGEMARDGDEEEAKPIQ